MRRSDDDGGGGGVGGWFLSVTSYLCSLRRWSIMSVTSPGSGSGREGGCPVREAPCVTDHQRALGRQVGDIRHGCQMAVARFLDPKCLGNALHPGIIQAKEGIKFCHLATLTSGGGSTPSSAARPPSRGAPPTGPPPTARRAGGSGKSEWCIR